jgi:zinc and cadmium transporter
MNWSVPALVGVVLLGGWLGWRFRRQHRNTLRILLSFSGSYLLGITLLHLLPEAYAIEGASLGVYVMSGFFLQLFLELLTKGVEHGHVHVHEGERLSNSYIGSVLIGLSIHAILEGLPLSETSLGVHTHHHSYLLLGIVAHKIPEAFSFVLLLTLAHFRNRTVLIAVLALSVMSPLGMYLPTILNGQGLLMPSTLAIIMGVVAGSFLHITATILFESENKNHTIGWQKLVAILLGAGLSLITMHA